MLKRVVLFLLLSSVCLAHPTPKTYPDPSWMERFAPHRMIGNVYYVGSKGLAAYLITGTEGHILINSNLPASVATIRENVEKLGFRFNDIKILLISHAHFDHCGGSDEIKKLTGARYFVMDSDVDVVETGGKSDFHYSNDLDMRFPATKVDRVLHDGDNVTLGDVVLTAHKTAGHTKGCTTWSMKVKDGKESRSIAIIGSVNVNDGYKLVANKTYPQIETDFKRTFEKLKSLSCEVFLGSHGKFFDLEKKYATLEAGAAKNPYLDEEGCKAYVADREEAFRKTLAKQNSPSVSKTK